MNHIKENKRSSHFMLTPETKEKIKIIAKEENISQANAVELMVNTYFESREEEHLLLKQTISKLIDEKMEPMNEKLRTLQVTGNVIDRDTKILLEFMNHYYLVNKFNKLATTEDYKTKGLQQAEDLIQKRIHKQRKKKLDYEQRKQQERTE
ncbi:hypothetical protein [Virgibacillus ihumii]|uniref:hypothetical protein n=1 Tax=Virgibacillus ihumii TaxID=2686091 RepID=UPI001FEBF3AA|nr:hypothetical protein [Virgibacillus ihumii]